MSAPTITAQRCRVVVLLSGSGSNLQALIDTQASSSYEIVAVISNKQDAFGLQRAAKHEIATETLSHRDFASRESFDAQLAELVDSFKPDLVVLAGFMRILTASFVALFAGRLVNIHPSLLPEFPGMNTHQRALDAGVSEHGVSVHFVTEELDGGPVIARRKVSVQADDTAESLAAKVLTEEHKLYPEVVEWFARGELSLSAGQALHSRLELPVDLEG
jgi:phosphoribosylglycinamide formyltransferase-1